eukprot:TRINITY_DN30710_c0_g1_i1.p1 TRINITY_DN30710_c0_g1~~TRINITY_DN30710_c0_g1_i1.p1  ORF type:complete len:195 (-),score=38.18 TRINITY_DN30710_c0_g1_i1:221-769(-)
MDALHELLATELQGWLDDAREDFIFCLPLPQEEQDALVPTAEVIMRARCERLFEKVLEKSPIVSAAVLAETLRTEDPTAAGADTPSVQLAEAHQSLESQARRLREAIERRKLQQRALVEERDTAKQQLLDARNKWLEAIKPLQEVSSFHSAGPSAQDDLHFAVQRFHSAHPTVGLPQKRKRT